VQRRLGDAGVDGGLGEGRRARDGHVTADLGPGDPEHPVEQVGAVFGCADLGQGAFDVLEEAARADQILLAEVGDRGAAGRALQQLPSDKGFQLGDGLGDRRLGQPHFLGGAGEALLARDSLEHPQVSGAGQILDGPGLFGRSTLIG
jgi:hypothetical protein